MAATVASGIVEADLVTPTVVFAGLVGAITWNLITWYYGLPSSSSHALIGGVVGAAFVAEGADAVIGDGLLGKVAVPALVAPMLAFVAAALAILFAYRIIGRQSPGPGEPRLPRRPDRLRRDAGARARHERRAEDDGRDHARADRERHASSGGVDPPDLGDRVRRRRRSRSGTYVGGWRIIRTMGSRIIKMDTAQGFSAQGSGAAVILAASHVGFPLSTTQTISGAVMGAGAAKRLSAVRWGVAGNIVLAWVLTIPAAAIVGGGVYALVSIFGDEARSAR